MANKGINRVRWRLILRFGWETFALVIYVDYIVGDHIFEKRSV